MKLIASPLIDASHYTALYRNNIPIIHYFLIVRKEIRKLRRLQSIILERIFTFFSFLPSISAYIHVYYVVFKKFKRKKNMKQNFIPHSILYIILRHRRIDKFFSAVKFNNIMPTTRSLPVTLEIISGRVLCRWAYLKFWAVSSLSNIASSLTITRRMQSIRISTTDCGNNTFVSAW